MYFGLSRESKMPSFRAKVVLSRDQKYMCPFPHVTNEKFSFGKGFHSAVSTKSEEHCTRLN